MFNAFARIAARALIVLGCIAPFAAQAFCIPDPFINESGVEEHYDASTDRYFLEWTSTLTSCGFTMTHPAPLETTLTGLSWNTPATAVACTGGSADSPLCALARPMCEFITTAAGVPSVFLTINAAECQALRQPGSGWAPVSMSQYPPGDASISAYDVDPATGQCAATTLPVYRFVRPGGAGEVVNHRYVVDESVRMQMRSRAGWHEEGVAFCVSRAARITIGYTDLQPWYVIGGDSQPLSCPNGLSFSNRFCLASVNMAPLESVFTLGDTPGVAPYHDKTGAQGYVIAKPESIAAASDAPQHSFGQMYPGVLLPAGYFLTYADRTSGKLSALTVNSGPYARVGAPLAAPFSAGYDVPMDVVLSYRLFVKSVRAEGDGNEAYVQPLVTFIDNANGHRLVLSPGGIGTVRGTDLAVADAATGNALVALALGTTTIGRSTGLPTLQTPKVFDAPNDRGWGGDFVFRINQAEFARAIALARAVDPALGTDPARYGVESVGLKGEIVGQSSIGYNIEYMRVSLVRP